MTAFLLTWNPDNFATSGEGPVKTLDYAVGEEVSWSCSSQQPQVGDRVYLIRLGKHQHPKGIVASGTVTRESFDDTHWTESSKQVSYIKFQIEDFRRSCAEGLLPMLLLRIAFPEQQWSPNSSGIEIKKASIEVLDDIWQRSKGQHSLATTLQWCFDKRGDDGPWFEMYRSLINDVKQAKETRAISDELLKNLWFDRNNGVSSVAPAGIPYSEYSQNIDWLREITFRVFNSPDKETLTAIYGEWQEHFSRTYWSVIQRVFSAADPDHLTSLVNYKYVARVADVIEKQFQIPIEKNKNWCVLNHNLTAAVTPWLQEGWGGHERNIALWNIYAHDERLKKQGQKGGKIPAGGEEVMSEFNQESLDYRPLGTNTILYGPPGTGKTFHTVEAAVRAADPEFRDVQDRPLLKVRYEQLVADGRIRFVTFHQSFSYEEFVEGLRANSENGQISYEIEPGIFKRICEDSASGTTTTEDELDRAISKFIEQIQDEGQLELTTINGKPFTVRYVNENSLGAFPGQSDKEDGHRISLKNIRQLYNGTLKNPKHYPYVRGALAHLKKTYSIPDYARLHTETRQNYVLVIDEINRGNISKIFGELITLIEPSKRVGQPEALTVRLPYSQDEFSVPGNLHIIGTMNTADRSLAMMDTALRRRFDFREMMPNCELLDDAMIQGVNIGSLLRRMNQRIEYLYDREHTLGHAFFMPLKELRNGDEGFIELQSIFRNKVIPLLEEYFFEDWEKIRLILADNQTDDADCQFVHAVEVSSQALFGNNYQDNTLDGENITYQLNSGAFENIEAYRKIAGEPIPAGGPEQNNG